MFQSYLVIFLSFLLKHTEKTTDKYDSKQKGGSLSGSIEEYKRKAEGFAENLKGARTAKIRGATDNVTRYYKNGKYLNKTADGKIISFGKQ